MTATESTKRTREDCREFREGGYQKQRAWFPGIPLFEEATLLGWERFKHYPAVSYVPKVEAHHIEPWVLTKNNSWANCWLISKGLHKIIHRQAEFEMKEFRRLWKCEPNTDFVRPVTRVFAKDRFDYIHETQPDIWEHTLANGENLGETWEYYLITKGLLD